MKRFRSFFVLLVLMVAIVTVISVSSARSSGGVSNYLPIVYKAPTPTVTPTPTITPSPTPGIPDSSCNVFFDDFSNEASGWSTGEDDVVRFGYINGEYRVRSKQGGYYLLFAAPSESADNYSVETDIRWEGNLGFSYGLLYEIRNDGREFYGIDMSSSEQAFRVLKFTDNLEFVYPPTGSSAIQTGNAVNHLRVDVNGGTQTFSINGVTVATTNEANNSARFVGIFTAVSPDVPQTDARFDNYCVSSDQAADGATGPAQAPELRVIPMSDVSELQSWK